MNAEKMNTTRGTVLNYRTSDGAGGREFVVDTGEVEDVIENIEKKERVTMTGSLSRS